MAIEDNPVNNVQWIDIDKVEPNKYNPNIVAKRELRLLALSILSDGYTQPIVAYHDKARDKYIIVDGFHRYYVMKQNKEVWDLTRGKLPIVVIDKDTGSLMASTIRHNRARGKHAIVGMSQVISELIQEGWNDEKICRELGLDNEELFRLKFSGGFPKFFENHKYSLSWEENKQIKKRIARSGELNGGKDVSKNRDEEIV